MQLFACAGDNDLWRTGSVGGGITVYRLLVAGMGIAGFTYAIADKEKQCYAAQYIPASVALLLHLLPFDGFKLFWNRLLDLVNGLCNRLYDWLAHCNHRKSGFAGNDLFIESLGNFRYPETLLYGRPCHGAEISGCRYAELALDFLHVWAGRAEFQREYGCLRWLCSYRLAGDIYRRHGRRSSSSYRRSSGTLCYRKVYTHAWLPVTDKQRIICCAGTRCKLLCLVRLETDALIVP